MSPVHAGCCQAACAWKGNAPLPPRRGHHSGALVAKEQAVTEFRWPRAPPLLGSKKLAFTHLPLLDCTSLSLHPSGLLASADCKGDIPFQGQGTLEPYPCILSASSALASSQKLGAEIGEGPFSRDYRTVISTAAEQLDPGEGRSCLHRGAAQRSPSDPSLQTAVSSAPTPDPRRFAQPELRSPREG